MDASARVAKLMLVRRNSRKDLAKLGTLFSQWSSARSASDPMRRMTMGGAPPPVPAPEPVDACMDAFCAVQLNPTNSITKQDGPLYSPRGSFKNLASLMLSPATSLKDGASLLSPQASLKSSLEALLRANLRTNDDTNNEAPQPDRMASVTSPAGVGPSLQVC
ncbi:hypothetical protein VOLCADRAFT_103090 [Volvox carteri f. nagariensis]|uniref:Uncharacterized protein n=1 Tax=Volvox carteri f. nagariensis TaxID=3068 RepID=D8TKL1_VOLCA|nr:uncharacterized protein VOLCADRAFT_103090 [Volvox carteri f. nagariensis]EFJ52082.1 hypothetical protein VOLCADRAFT_103090 [Volvox carteri f. nagariensis]|eukprot:XP_002946856.1 hypothetical protein VOLCADRAFT_103090 [Volvox carteri f. nagariensis]